MARTWKNPLGYWCAPNAATPEYVASTDVLEFLGFGWMDCADGWADDIAGAIDFKDFIREIRQKLLANVRSALAMLLQEWDEIRSDEFPFSYGESMDTGSDLSVIFQYGGEKEVLVSINVEYRELEIADEKLWEKEFKEYFPPLVSILLCYGASDSDDRAIWLNVPKSKVVVEHWLGKLDDAEKILKEV